MIETIFGVDHALQLASLLYCETRPVRPSLELMQRLASLPPGTKVGVEFTDEQLSFSSNDVTERLRLSNGMMVRFLPAEKYYWRKIVYNCYRHGLEVIFLDDFEVQKQIAEKTIEIKHYEGKLAAFQARLQREGHVQADRSLVQGWVESCYRAEVEANALFIFEREKRILQKMADTDPSFVIVGAGHGDLIALNKDQMAAQGIVFSQYQREEVFDSDGYFSQPRKVYSSFFSLREPESTFLERDLLKRQLNAVTQWRVLPGQDPDLVGTWSLQNRADGLFEMYLNKSNGNRFEGVIEDTRGTATFRGQLDGQEISFFKEYASQESQGQSSLPLYYQGRLENGVIRGRYDFVNSDGEVLSSEKNQSFILFVGNRFNPDIF